MDYQVRLTAPAEADAYAAFERIRADAPTHAARWLNGFFNAVRSLARARCPLIAEAEDLHREIRQLLYGKGTGTYRILFDVEDESLEGPRVRVLRVWHSSRDRIRMEDLEFLED